MHQDETGAEIFCMLHTVSTNTIETFQEKKKIIRQVDPSAFVFPCCNLQRESGGSAMSGVFCDLDGGAKVSALEFGSDEIFKGISVVRCHMTDMEIARALNNPAAVRSTLKRLLNSKESFPNLQDILPSEKGQVCLRWC